MSLNCSPHSHQMPNLMTFSFYIHLTDFTEFILAIFKLFVNKCKHISKCVHKQHTFMHILLNWEANVCTYNTHIYTTLLNWGWGENSGVRENSKAQNGIWVVLKDWAVTYYANRVKRNSLVSAKSLSDTIGRGTHSVCRRWQQAW